ALDTLRERICESEKSWRSALGSVASPRTTLTGSRLARDSKKSPAKAGATLRIPGVAQASACVGRIKIRLLSFLPHQCRNPSGTGVPPVQSLDSSTDTPALQQKALPVAVAEQLYSRREADRWTGGDAHPTRIRSGRSVRNVETPGTGFSLCLRGNNLRPTSDSEDEATEYVEKPRTFCATQPVREKAATAA